MKLSGWTDLPCLFGYEHSFGTESKIILILSSRHDEKVLALRHRQGEA